MIVTKYNTEQIHNNWFAISKLIENSIQFSGCDDYELEDIKQYLYNEQMLCFVGIEQNITGVVIISLIVYPKQTVAFITSYGGKFVTNTDAWGKLLNEFKKLGVTKVQGLVRKSLARLTKRLGFVDKQILVEYKV